LVAIDRWRRLGGVEILRGRAAEAEQRFERAIELAKKPGAKLDVDARAELERSHAFARFLRGDVGGAHRLLETTLRERRGLRPATRARVLTLLGSLALRAGRSGRAREALDEALALATSVGDDELVATAQTNRATLFLREGRLIDAEHALLAARPLRARLGHAWEEAALANNLGLVLRDLGRIDDDARTRSTKRCGCAGRWATSPVRRARSRISASVHRTSRDRCADALGRARSRRARSSMPRYIRSAEAAAVPHRGARRHGLHCGDLDRAYAVLETLMRRRPRRGFVRRWRSCARTWS
jgi:tetratricopeptide (TPR) repeat protein